MAPGSEDRPSIGLDIGGTKISAGLVDASGRILRRDRAATPGSSPALVERTVADLVAGLRREAPDAPVGVGAAGWMNPETGTVLFSPHLAWRNEPLRDRLVQLLGTPVAVVNDADAAGWAEYRFGAGRDESSLVCLTLGTGIGGALVTEGRVRRGRYGVAGEFGHQVIMPGGHRCECGNRGCWEQYASGNALGREGRELARAHSPVAHTLLDAAAGDIDAIDGALVTEWGSRDRPAGTGRRRRSWLRLGLASLAAAGPRDLRHRRRTRRGISTAAGERNLYRRHLTGRGYRPSPRSAGQGSAPTRAHRRRGPGPPRRGRRPVTGAPCGILRQTRAPSSPSARCRGSLNAR
ncbi:ROK family protein [Arthrobacter sp.]|uniref:ROK family protein n=1 Tax=Arthrobacter sp. TaxID=1667 RepID=UPI003A8E2D61